LDNKKIKIDFNDVNAWKLPAAMYFGSELKKDSIIVYSGFTSEMPCCISGGECKVFNSIDAVAGYIKHHLLYDNIAYNILKMEYSTTADECEDEAFLMDIQDIWNQNVGAIGLLEYVEESHPDRWDENLAELKSYVEAVSNTLDRIFECNDENEKKIILVSAGVIFNDLFADTCRWSFDLFIYFGTAEFAERYEDRYNIPSLFRGGEKLWEAIKSGQLDDEHTALLNFLVQSMNA